MDQEQNSKEGPQVVCQESNEIPDMTKQQNKPMTSEHNQTHPDWLKHTKSGKETGTGIFLVPDPSKGVLAHSKVMVPNLTYRDAAMRGHTCTAFKWVPTAVKSHSDLVAGVGCSGSCISWQDCGDPSCMCSQGQCY